MCPDIEFDAEGALLRGWFHETEGARGPAPCVVMAHGWSSTKRMYLDRFAEVFAAAGLAVLVYDNRGWGDSEAAPGQPRHEIDPWVQVADYRHAITYAQNRSEVDPDRIGVWGTSFPGAHAYVVAAMDRRVKAVVTQAPFVSGRATYANLARVDNQVVGSDVFTADRRARARGEAAATIPVIGTDPGQLVGLPTRDSHEWFSRARAELDPRWPNEVTLRTPLLMIVDSEDGLTGGNLAAVAYSSAAEPKDIVFLPSGHFDATPARASPSPRRRHATGSCGTSRPRYSRTMTADWRRRASCPGGAPNIRRYSRLNCDELS